MTFDEVQFSRLELRPDEVLVLRVDAVLSTVQTRKLIKDVQDIIGEKIPVLALGGGTDVSTIKPPSPDKAVTQEFAIRNVLTGHCGQALTPDLLDEIVEEVVKEMRFGGTRWAFE